MRIIPRLFSAFEKNQSLRRIVVLVASIIVIITFLWTLFDARVYPSSNDKFAAFQTLLTALQFPAILAVAYELRRQLDQRRKPDIKIGVKSGFLEFHRVPESGDLPQSDKMVKRNGAFTVILRNDGDANLEGMSVTVFPKSARNISPPDQVHMYDRANRRVWHSTDKLTRLVRKERLTIGFESDRRPEHGAGEFQVGVVVLGDNLPEPIEATLTLTHGTWNDVIED